MRPLPRQSPAYGGGSDCARLRSPPFGAPRRRPAGLHRSDLQVRTVPSPVPTRTAALNGADRRRPRGPGQGGGASHPPDREELAKRCPLAPVIGRGGLSRQPHSPAPTARLYDLSSGASRHAMAKPMPSRPFAGVWLERPLHLSLVSFVPVPLVWGISRRGNEPVKQVQSTRQDERCIRRAKTRVHQTAGTGPGNFSARFRPGQAAGARGKPRVGAVRFLDTLRARPAVHTCGCWCGELFDRRASSW